MQPFKKLIVSTIHSILLPVGFEKDGTIWFKEQNGILVLAALSSSPYGFQSYTIQIGVHVKEIAEAGTIVSKRGIPRPVVGWWQVIKNLRGDNDELISALDAECDIADASRVNTLVKVLTSEALPMLGEFETADGLREFIIRTNCLVTVSLRKWLDLPPRIGAQSE